MKDEIKISKQPEILDECKQFYEKLYTKSVECNLFENYHFFKTNRVALRKKYANQNYALKSAMKAF